MVFAPRCDRASRAQWRGQRQAHGREVESNGRVAGLGGLRIFLEALLGRSRRFAHELLRLVSRAQAPRWQAHCGASGVRLGDAHHGCRLRGRELDRPGGRGGGRARLDQAWRRSLREAMARARATGHDGQKGRAMKIITADERLAARNGPKILVVGPSGVGKTSLLRTLRAELLASTLFIDIEAGNLAIADLPVASVRPRTWNECRDIACALGGPNPALPPTAAYSDAHYAEVMKNAELAKLVTFPILFVDSLTAAGRLCFTWAEQQPEATSDRGRKDLRGIYGLHARSMIGWLNQLQHAREKTVVFVAVLERHIDELNIATWQPQIEGTKTGRELPAI